MELRMFKADMKDLVYWLNYYTQKYDEGNPVISDREWDEIYFTLLKMEQEQGIVLPDSPTNSIQFTAWDKLQKVKHNHPMLSLAKTKDVAELKSFFNDEEYIVMSKLDGLTCSLTYRDGVLVRAETRGNGIEGEDITHNAKVIPSIPKKINTKEEVIVDGEIICTYKNFEHFSSEYKNPRNFASGSIRLLDNKECATRGLTFVAWDWINSPETTLNNSLTRLKTDFGFEIVPFRVPAFEYGDTMEDCMESVKRFSEASSYPIDGLVLKINDIVDYQMRGKTDHHFRGGIAYKFYDEEYETELLNIEWSMGRTGQITPIAIFKNLNIDGTNVSRASLSNLSIMKETLGEKPFIGQKVYVSKRNMIIPKIEKAKDEYDKWI